MDRARESVWQAAWASRGLATARRVPGRAKFYALVAYPGASGFLHVGHLRGLVYADAFHRFHRMRGRQVFFPTGTHASGLPAVTFAQKVRERDPAVVAQLEENGVPPERWPELEEPTAAARFLGASYLAVFRRLGLLVDESAYVTTIDDDYRAFIGWQFRRLHALGALVQAPHFAAVCPVCGPVSVDPSETDLASGGDAEWIVFHTVPFRLDDGRVLLAATLRPETVYGATNVWLHPSEPLVVWHLGSAEFLVGARTGSRFVEQHGGHLGHAVAVDHLRGRTVVAPLTGARLPLLTSPLVDPAVGSGVVMSVPAHAPADWLAVGALPPEERSRLPPIPEIVDLPGPEGLTASEAALLAGTGVPAERAVRATGARSLDDVAALATATERLYRLEFLRGRMRGDLVGGAPVAAARERVVAELRPLPGGFDLKEFSKPVTCRNGHDVVIRKVPDQWFVHYADPAWKAATRALVARMRFFPPEYGEELPSILDWFADRPCVRRGRWLGTPFPLDPSWIIEPIADSTFYPAYFVVRRFVHRGDLAVAQLTDALFDRVFLGTGPGEPSVSAELQAAIAEEFRYWYPLDLNVGGKEHKRVHFPVFLATHARLLPPELQPRGIFVNWWLTEKGGGKLSKKRTGKGGAIPPIQDAIERWGADALRLFYVQAASPHQDIEWDPALVDSAVARLAEIERTVRELAGDGAGGPPELDAWLTSEMHALVRDATQAFEDGALRAASELVYSRAPALLRRYVTRGGGAGAAAGAFVARWVALLGPVTPFVAEELGARPDGPLVAEGPWPDASELADRPAARAAEAYLDGVEADLRSVVRLAEGRGERPTAVEFFVAAPWKATLERWVCEATAGGAPVPPIRELLARAAADPTLVGFRAEMPAYLQRFGASLRAEPPPPEAPVDEVKVLRAAEGYLARRFGLERVGVFPEAEAEAHDPAGRRQRARPGRPAFYLVSPGAGPGAARPDAAGRGRRGS